MPETHAVLLYPPIGRPRAVSLPIHRKDATSIVGNTVKLYDTRAEAEAALRAFLVANPEYTRWVDGCIPQSA